jgi:hypothetical protein
LFVCVCVVCVCVYKRTHKYSTLTGPGVGMSALMAVSHQNGSSWSGWTCADFQVDFRHIK